jgi:hypothetical protein
MDGIALTPPSGNIALPPGSDQKLDQAPTLDRTQSSGVPSGSIAQVPRTQAAMPFNKNELSTRYEVAKNSGFDTADANRWSLLQRVIQTAPGDIKAKALDLQNGLDIGSRNVVDDQRTVDRAASDPFSKVWFTPANKNLNSATAQLKETREGLNTQRGKVDAFLENPSTFPYYQNPVQPSRAY